MGLVKAWFLSVEANQCVRSHVFVVICCHVVVDDVDVNVNVVFFSQWFGHMMYDLLTSIL